NFKVAYLGSLPRRVIIGARPATPIAIDASDPSVPFPPLDQGELEHVLACYRSIGADAPQIYANNPYIQIVVAELGRAGREDEANKMWNEFVANATQPTHLGPLLAYAVQSRDFNSAIKILERLAEVKQLPANENIYTATGAVNTAVYYSTPFY